jgi:hypothetical protein
LNQGVNLQNKAKQRGTIGHRETCVIHDPELIEKARQIGADEEKSAADELLRTLAKMPPHP